jgi:hypothetical protein
LAHIPVGRISAFNSLNSLLVVKGYTLIFRYKALFDITNHPTNTTGLIFCYIQSSHRKSNSSSRRRGGLFSKYIKGLEKSMVLDPAGVRNQEGLCWRKCKLLLCFVPWSWALLANPPFVLLLKNFPIFYGTRRFSTVFTRTYYWSPSWARWIQSIPPRSIPLRSISIWSSRSS